MKIVKKKRKENKRQSIRIENKKQIRTHVTRKLAYFKAQVARKLAVANFKITRGFFMLIPAACKLKIFFLVESLILLFCAHRNVKIAADEFVNNLAISGKRLKLDIFVVKLDLKIVRGRKLLITKGQISLPCLLLCVEFPSLHAIYAFAQISMSSEFRHFQRLI